MEEQKNKKNPWLYAFLVSLLFSCALMIQNCNQSIKINEYEILIVEANALVQDLMGLNDQLLLREVRRRR